jgi:hypothetical protein
MARCRRLFRDFRRAMTGAILPALVLLFVILSCNENSGTSGGAGTIGEVGEACNSSNCYVAWCADSHQDECPSNDCVGQNGGTYCTIPCDLDGNCPTNYRCTLDCNAKVFSTAICVKQADYTYLQSQGWCAK